ncbi:hypothetical protein ACFY7C_08330 [Streptomyces sp. NPDC012769]|uniref:hypothetical protein n=1 Tax=Streptomyces sp. NPDC012769 TaxID=3364848 RepID=UPI0036849816
MNKQGLEMRHMPDTGTVPEREAKKDEKKRFDLSVPQVAGSAVAAVFAAKLASTLGVYGTIVGAGVISVIATCGGPLLQHLFKRTGEQMRGATVTRPRLRRAGTLREAAPHEAAPHEAASHGSGADGEFGEPTTHGTRVRGWKRPAAGAAVVFLIAMGGITAYELTSGQDLSGAKGTTTFGSVVRGQGGGDEGADKGEERRPGGGGTPSSTPSADTGRGDRGEPTGSGTPTPGGDSGTGTGTGTGSATPDPTSTPTPTPTPSRSAEPSDDATTAPPTTPPDTDAGSVGGAAAE